MKHLLLVCCVALLALSTRSHAAPPAALPPDTVAGEARLTRRLTQGICEQVALESRHQDLAVLTRKQGTALLESLLIGLIARDSAEFKAFVLAAPDAEAAMQRLTVRAMLDLASTCPTASALLTQMGVQMAGLDTKLSTEQEQVLRAAARDFCGQLALADREREFSARTAAGRMAVYQKARHEIITTHGAAMVAAFGQQLLTDAQAEDTMWKNVDRLMYEQCPAVTGTLRVDFGLQRLQAPAPPAVQAAPTRGPVPVHRRKKK